MSFLKIYIHYIHIYRIYTNILYSIFTKRQLSLSVQKNEFALVCINIYTVHQVSYDCSNNCNKIGRPKGIGTGSRNRRRFKLMKSNKFVSCKMSLRHPTRRSIICPKTQASHSKSSSSLANASDTSSSKTLLWKCITVWSSHFQKVCLTSV